VSAELDKQIAWKQRLAVRLSLAPQEAFTSISRAIALVTLTLQIFLGALILLGFAMNQVPGGVGILFTRDHPSIPYLSSCWS
jgi:hypothetical protein